MWSPGRPRPRRSLEILTLYMRFLWVSITPLGRPVEPEVYCKNARVSSVMSGRALAAPAEGSSSSVESHESAASSGAWGINNVGVVVGRIVATGDVPHAFRWKGGRLDDLNTLVEAEGWTLSEARDINDDGVIVGSGQRNGELRAFRLDPIDPGNPIPPFVVTQPQGGQFGLGESTTLTVTATDGTSSCDGIGAGANGCWTAANTAVTCQ